MSSVEGVLGAEALADPLDVDVALIVAAGVVVQRPAPVAESFDETIEGESSKLGDGFDSEIVERLFARRTDPVQTANRQRREESLDLGRFDHREPVGFVVIRGDLGDELVGRHAHRHRETAFVA